jgi:hypothetical protein
MRSPQDMTFPASADEFYRRRDDRTNRYISCRDYQRAQCVVTIDSAAIHTQSGQTTLLVACNLLSRWCRHVEVVLAPDDLDADSIRGGKLENEVMCVMRDADPFGAFSWGDRHRAGDALRLHIGSLPIDSDPQVTVINGAGWLAGLGAPFCATPFEARDSNIIGPVAAACLGVAQVFKRAIGFPTEGLIREGLFDLFNLEWLSTTAVGERRPIVRNIQPGRVLLVGGGAVGSSFAYCIRLAPVRCEVGIVDKDYVLIENFNRSPIFGKSTFGMPKADVVGNALRNASVAAYSFPIPWNEFIAAHAKESREFDVWLPLANEDNVRASIQNNIPPLLIYAATNSNWGASHGRWIPGRDDCLMDRFPMDGEGSVLQCSTSEIETKEGRVDAALPFLSMFAGLMVFADLVRLQMRGYPQVPNYCLIDFGGRLETVQKWDMHPRENCGCRTLSPALYKGFNRLSKYFGLAFPESRPPHLKT